MEQQVKAFPLSFQWDEQHAHNNGMDLRDYFAAKALPTAFAMAKHDYDRELPEGYLFGDSEDYEELAVRAYAIADAMMKERKT